MSTRKSTRIMKSGRSRLPTVQNGDCCASSDDEDVNNNEAPKPKAKAGQKRKARSSSDKAGGPAPKRPKGTKALLEGVVDMPLDIVFEIFGNLYPVDLLNLAQTSKDLRNILMSKSSAFIWRQARANVEVPDCPADLSEPQYASLCFEKYCTSCQRAKMTPSTTCHIWGARLRLCRDCAMEQCTSSTSSAYYRTGLTSSQLLEMIPSFTIHDRSNHWRYYHQASLLSWSARLARATSQEDKDRVEQELRALHVHEKACQVWLTKYQQECQDQRLADIAARKNLVVERAKTLSWGEELQLSPNGIDELKESDAIVRACSKNLPDKSWSRLDKVINEVLESVRVERLAKAMDALLGKRLPLLVQVLQQCRQALSPTEPLPSPRQLYEIPFVRDLVLNTPPDVEMTTANFQPIADNFATLTGLWRFRMKVNLMDLVKSADPSSDVDANADVFLNRASTFFVCRCCVGHGVGYPRVLVHSCARDRYYGIGCNSESESPLERKEDKILTRILKEVSWNGDGEITYRPDIAAMLGDMIELCGLDRNATKAEMDAVDPILECLACHKACAGRAVMRWSNVIYHWFYHHVPQDYGFKILEKPKMKLRVVADLLEADALRKELTFHEEKFEAVTPLSVCAQCHERGTTVKLKAHWKQDINHNRKAVDGDILPSLDRMHYDEAGYYSWPPRDDDDHALISGTEIEPHKVEPSEKVSE